jgi:hypothetical protein
MRLDKFVDDNLGKKVDFDGVYGAQCVDLFREYCQDVWQIPHTGGVEGAKDLFAQKAPGLQYLSIGSAQALPGDVVIWDASQTNKYGHVAILLYGTDTTLVVLEQDGFAQTGVKIVVRNTTRCLGFIRKA